MAINPFSITSVSEINDNFLVEWESAGTDITYTMFKSYQSDMSSPITVGLGLDIVDQTTAIEPEDITAGTVYFQVHATDGTNNEVSQIAAHIVSQPPTPPNPVIYDENSFESLIQETLMNIEGAAGTPETYATLTGNLDATSATFGLSNAVYSDGSGVSVGVVEIDTELISILQVNGTALTGEAAVNFSLRGFRGTKAASHSAGALVRINPRITKIQVARAINDTITSLHPRLPVIKSYEFTYTGNKTRYALPSDVLNVIQVSYSLPGSTGEWAPSRRWSFDATTTSADGQATRAIDVKDALSSRKVQVVYQATASRLVNADDEFSTVTGLPDWARDIVIYGACYRVAALLDGQKVTSLTAEQAMMNQRGAYGSTSATSGTQLSRYYFSLYQARLAEAESRIQDIYPATRHYIR